MKMINKISNSFIISLAYRIDEFVFSPSEKSEKYFPFLFRSFVSEPKCFNAVLIYTKNRIERNFVSNGRNRGAKFGFTKVNSGEFLRQAFILNPALTSRVRVVGFEFLSKLFSRDIFCFATRKLFRLPIERPILFQ